MRLDNIHALNYVAKHLAQQWVSPVYLSPILFLSSFANCKYSIFHFINNKSTPIISNQ